MANIVKVISSEIIKLARKVKVLSYGSSNVRTANEAMPFGMDSAPLKNMRAIFGETDKKGNPVIIGYINKNQIAGEGETRLFSLDSNGNLAMFIYLKSNGDLLLGGEAKHLAKYEELKVGFDQLKQDFNNFLTHVHGGSGTPPTPPAVPSTASVDDSKADKIKTL